MNDKICYNLIRGLSNFNDIDLGRDARRIYSNFTNDEVDIVNINKQISSIIDKIDKVYIDFLKTHNSTLFETLRFNKIITETSINSDMKKKIYICILSSLFDEILYIIYCKKQNKKMIHEINLLKFFNKLGARIQFRTLKKFFSRSERTLEYYFYFYFCELLVDCYVKNGGNINDIFDDGKSIFQYSHPILVNIFMTKYNKTINKDLLKQLKKYKPVSYLNYKDYQDVYSRSLRKLPRDLRNKIREY